MKLSCKEKRGRVKGGVVGDTRQTVNPLDLIDLLLR
jgi:hypothetical protein